MSSIGEFLRERPHLIEEYIEHCRQCIRRMAQQAFEEGLSLEQYEKKWKRPEVIKEKEMHKKIMKKAASKLMRDAAFYSKEAKHTKSKVKKKHELVEKKEALSAAKDLKKRAKKAHE